MYSIASLHHLLSYACGSCLKPQSAAGAAVVAAAATCHAILFLLGANTWALGARARTLINHRHTLPSFPDLIDRNLVLRQQRLGRRPREGKKGKLCINKRSYSWKEKDSRLCVSPFLKGGTYGTVKRACTWILLFFFLYERTQAPTYSCSVVCTYLSPPPSILSFLLLVLCICLLLLLPYEL